MLGYYIGSCFLLAVVKTMGDIRYSSEYRDIGMVNHFTRVKGEKSIKEQTSYIEKQLKDNIFHITMFPVMYFIRKTAN